MAGNLRKVFEVLESMHWNKFWGLCSVLLNSDISQIMKENNSWWCLLYRTYVIVDMGTSRIRSSYTNLLAAKKPKCVESCSKKCHRQLSFLFTYSLVCEIGSTHHYPPHGLPLLWNIQFRILLCYFLQR